MKQLEILRLEDAAAITSLLRRAAKQSHLPLKEDSGGGAGKGSGVKELTKQEPEKKVTIRSGNGRGTSEPPPPGGKAGKGKGHSTSHSVPRKQADSVQKAPVLFPDDWPVPVRTQLLPAHGDGIVVSASACNRPKGRLQWSVSIDLSIQTSSRSRWRSAWESSMGRADEFRQLKLGWYNWETSQFNPGTASRTPQASSPGQDQGGPATYG